MSMDSTRQGGGKLKGVLVLRGWELASANPRESRRFHSALRAKHAQGAPRSAGADPAHRRRELRISRDVTRHVERRMHRPRPGHVDVGGEAAAEDLPSVETNQP